MAPTSPQRERGEGSGSRSARKRRRRQRTPTPLTRTESPPPSQRAKRKKRKDHKQDQEGARAAVSGSDLAEHDSSGASSAVSSPIRWPLLCRTVKGEDASGRKVFEPFIKIKPSLVDAYEEMKFKYHEKRGDFFCCPLVRFIMLLVNKYLSFSSFSNIIGE